MSFRTGRACVIAIYDQTSDEVAAFLNLELPKLAHFSSWKALRSENSSWHSCFMPDGKEISCDIYQNPYNLTFSQLSIEARTESLDVLEKVFYALQSLPVKPREVTLADEDQHMLVGELLSYADSDSADIDDHLNAAEGNHGAFAIHSRRAYRKDTLADPLSWELAAEERGFIWTESDNFFVLDLHWAQRLAPTPRLHPTTNLLTENPFGDLFHQMTETATGTAFLVQLSRKDLNPERSHSKWLEVLPPIAEALENYSLPDGIIGHYYSPRSFLISKPSVSKAESKSERQNLLRLLSDLGTPNSRVQMMSWPEDKLDHEDLFCTFMDLTVENKT